MPSKDVGCIKPIDLTGDDQYQLHASVDPNTSISSQPISKLEENDDIFTFPGSDHDHGGLHDQMRLVCPYRLSSSHVLSDVVVKDRYAEIWTAWSHFHGPATTVFRSSSRNVTFNGCQSSVPYGTARAASSLCLSQ